MHNGKKQVIDKNVKTSPSGDIFMKPFQNFAVTFKIKLANTTLNSGKCSSNTKIPGVLNDIQQLRAGFFYDVMMGHKT